MPLQRTSLNVEAKTETSHLPTKTSRALHTLFRWRSAPSFGWPEWIVLTTYVTVLARVLPYHERWADEVQAWYLATDNSIWQILRHRMHYEGAPALWHIILHTFHLLGGTVFGMSWLGAAFATSAVLVLLRWSPFPLVLRILIPFTYFFAYQYAIIARGYTLFALLCFGLCVLYSQPKRWVSFVLVAGLLANLSLQGAIVAFLAFILFLLDLSLAPAAEVACARAGQRRAMQKSLFLRKIAGPVFLFAPFLVAASVVALPAPDVNFAVSGQVSDGTLHRLLIRFPGALPKTRPDPPPNPALPPEAEPTEPSFHLFAPNEWLGWYIDHPRLNAHGMDLGQSTVQAFLEFTLGMAAQATWPVATSRSLACLFLITWIVWLKSMGFLRGAVIWFSLILVGQILWVADHHAGMLLIALISVVWIARQRVLVESGSAPPGIRLDGAFLLLSALVAALQVHWTYVCMRNDIYGKYAPGQDTAAVLQQILARNPSARIAGFDSMAETVQPYFSRNPFFNMPDRFWIWSETDNPNAQHQATIATHPDAVLFTDEMSEAGIMRNTWATLSRQVSPAEQRDLTRNPIINDLRANGYIETHRFCGHRFSRDSSSFINCHLIFEPANK